MTTKCPKCNAVLKFSWSQVGGNVVCDACGSNIYLAIDGEEEDFCIVEAIVNDDFTDNQEYVK